MLCPQDNVSLHSLTGVPPHRGKCSYREPNKKPNDGYLGSCWLEVSHRPPKQYYCHYTILYIVITLSVTNKAIVLAYPPEPGGKTLLLKSPHTLVTGHRKTKSVLNRKLQPWRQAFRTRKNAMQVHPAVNLMHYSRDRESYNRDGQSLNQDRGQAEQAMPLGAIVV